MEALTLNQIKMNGNKEESVSEKEINDAAIVLAKLLKVSLDEARKELEQIISTFRGNYKKGKNE